ncbi:ATP synthase mitochondrial F1 complex assembly factor 1 [Vespa velutina]|uniref:ATP synthase mitochondrial F1 complex assembly factor 1 n=1 Tax=Vespa velutina TaxID=202808 RepID=UPI001FB21DCC|nr:ATP synthase mitochondrial F1 complex assembly factor 1 [Vespa velutina]
MRLWFSSISRCSPYITGNKVSVTFRIIMSRTKTDQVLENLKNNPYFDKYAKKIAELQQINPDLLKERIEEEEKKVQKRKEKQEEERSIYRAKAKSEVIEGSHTKEVRLSDIMNMEMIKGKAKEEIEEIWTEYHKQKDYICATMEPEQYERIFDYGKKYPLFLLPLPRKQGYEFFLSQFQGNKVYMTSLLWYQTHKENAPECLTLTHYTEFKDSKGIVLMRGEFDLNFLNCQEAQCLANELQLYYTGKSSERLKLMETFNNAPNDFKYNDLISQLEKISFVT